MTLQGLLQFRSSNTVLSEFTNPYSFPNTIMTDKETQEQAKTSAIVYAKVWGGKSLSNPSLFQNMIPTFVHTPTTPLVLTLLLTLESSVPPTVLATLITAQALRPPQFLPLIFPPLLLFSTYLNISDYKVEAAGINAAWSGLYMLLARRRKQPLARKFGTRGLIRGATLGMCTANLVCGGLVYAVGKRRGDGDDAA